MASTVYDPMDRAGLEFWLHTQAGDNSERRRRLLRNLPKAVAAELTPPPAGGPGAVHGEGHERDADRGGAGRQQVHGVPFTAPGAPQTGALPAI